MLLAHIGGIPVEELLIPLATAFAGGMLLPLASYVRRYRKK
jgi:hypothetical protein